MYTGFASLLLFTHSLLPARPFALSPILNSPKYQPPFRLFRWARLCEYHCSSVYFRNGRQNLLCFHNSLGSGNDLIRQIRNANKNRNDDISEAWDRKKFHCFTLTHLLLTSFWLVPSFIFEYSKRSFLVPALHSRLYSLFEVMQTFRFLAAGPRVCRNP